MQNGEGASHDRRGFRYARRILFPPDAGLDQNAPSFCKEQNKRKDMALHQALPKSRQQQVHGARFQACDRAGGDVDFADLVLDPLTLLEAGGLQRNLLCDHRSRSDKPVWHRPGVQDEDRDRHLTACVLE
jgi:hypothetical protein